MLGKTTKEMRVFRVGERVIKGGRIRLGLTRYSPPKVYIIYTSSLGFELTRVSRGLNPSPTEPELRLMFLDPCPTHTFKYLTQAHPKFGLGSSYLGQPNPSCMLTNNYFWVFLNHEMCDSIPNCLSQSIQKLLRLISLSGDQIWHVHRQLHELCFLLLHSHRSLHQLYEFRSLLVLTLGMYLAVISRLKSSWVMTFLAIVYCLSILSHHI